MTFFYRSWCRYLLILPFAVLIAQSVFFMVATKKIKGIVLNEKYIEVTNNVNMIAAAIEAGGVSESAIIAAMEYLDGLYQVYAAAYKDDGVHLVLISVRNFETSIFEPFDFPEFTKAVETQDSGNLVVGYTPSEQPHRGLHTYFRWVADKKYLLISGVSEHSIVTEVPMWISLDQWGGIFITFILNVILVILLCQLGHVYAARGGKSKWRDECK